MTSKSNQEDQQQSAEHERRLLRRFWWVFPLAGMAVSTVAHRWGWYLITLDPSLIAPGWMPTWGMAHWLLFAGMAAFPLAWWGGLLMEKRLPPGCRSLSVAVVLSLLAITAVDVGVRTPGLQGPFWLASRARLLDGNRDFFSREVAYIRLAHQDPSQQVGGGMVVAGTSQVLRNFDFDLLRESFDGPVKRRGVAGMVPIKLCAMQDYLTLREGDTLILYLSEFDLTGLRELDVDGTRPLACWSGVRAIWRHFPWSVRREEWRRWWDLSMAATSELWRMRDSARQMLFRLNGPAPANVEEDDAARLAVQVKSYRVAPPDGVYVKANKASVKEILALAEARAVEVVIFEGRLNPAMDNAESLALRVEARAFYADLARSRERVSFIAVDEQGVELADHHWLDGTHLNPAGAAVFTEYVVLALQERELNLEPR